MRRDLLEIMNAYHSKSSHSSAIPAHAGNWYYLKYGAINLPYLEQEKTYARFEGPQELKLEVEMNETHQVENLGMAERLAAALATRYAPGVDVDKIRSRSRTATGLKGEELVMRMSARGEDTQLNFSWEYRGEVDSGERPEILITMETPDGNLDAKLKVWDRILDSFKPIIAGEAAGAVLLERESHARRRNAPALAVLSSWGRGTEYNSWFGVPPATGKGLTEGFQAAFSGLEDGGKAIATIVADLNGERHRALDWAYTEGRIFHDTERERELRHPAFLTGDCGGATGAVMLADALGRLAFHPSFRGGIALTASDESGARRVLCLERGDRADRRAFIRDDPHTEGLKVEAEEVPSCPQM